VHPRKVWIMNLAACDSSFSIDDLAARIRKSSNFRFNWQFYQCTGIDPESPTELRQALDAIITMPELHEFLRGSFDPMYADAFAVEPLHEHCQVVPAAGEFENILAAAAGDHLGAYSQKMRDATTGEKQRINKLFGGIGEYRAYRLTPGNIPDCAMCRDGDNHLFSTWFFGVAWDWCLIALWPQRNLLWMGCLTDTD